MMTEAEKWKQELDKRYKASIEAEEAGESVSCYILPEEPPEEMNTVRLAVETEESYDILYELGQNLFRFSDGSIISIPESIMGGDEYPPNDYVTYRDEKEALARIRAELSKLMEDGFIEEEDLSTMKFVVEENQ